MKAPKGARAPEAHKGSQAHKEGDVEGMVNPYRIPPEQRPEEFQTEDSFGEVNQARVVWARWGYQGYEAPDPARGLSERSAYRDQAGNLVLVGKLRVEIPDGRIRDILYPCGKGWQLASGRSGDNIWEEEVVSTKAPRPDGKPPKFATQSKYGKLLDGCYDIGLNIGTRGSATKIIIFEGLVFDFMREEYTGVSGAVEVPVAFYPELSAPPFEFERRAYTAAAAAAPAPASAPTTAAAPAPPVVPAPVAPAPATASTASTASGWLPGEQELIVALTWDGNVRANDLRTQIQLVNSAGLDISNDLMNALIGQTLIPRWVAEGKVNVVDGVLRAAS